LPSVGVLCALDAAENDEYESECACVERGWSADDVELVERAMRSRSDGSESMRGRACRASDTDDIDGDGDQKKDAGAGSEKVPGAVVGASITVDACGERRIESSSASSASSAVASVEEARQGPSRNSVGRDGGGMAMGGLLVLDMLWLGGGELGTDGDDGAGAVLLLAPSCGPNGRCCASRLARRSVCELPAKDEKDDGKRAGEAGAGDGEACGDELCVQGADCVPPTEAMRERGRERAETASGALCGCGEGAKLAAETSVGLVSGVKGRRSESVGGPVLLRLRVSTGAEEASCDGDVGTERRFDGGEPGLPSLRRSSELVCELLPLAAREWAPLSSMLLSRE
jgi:hypothetical protein